VLFQERRGAHPVERLWAVCAIDLGQLALVRLPKARIVALRVAGPRRFLGDSVGQAVAPVRHAVVSSYSCAERDA
jgi:hypothetical protein